MVETLRPDICIVGAGAGGLTVALAAAALGVPAVLVEKEERGGDLRTGSVPSRALHAAARMAEAVRRGEAFGIASDEPTVDFKRVGMHIAETMDALAPNAAPERLTALGIRLVRAAAEFKDSRTLLAGDLEIQARRFVVATGASPFIPQIPGLDDIELLTSETVFAQQRRPAHLIVIGAGATGLELAQAHKRLGSEVTVIEAYAALGKEDPEMAAVVLRALRAEGVTILENAKIQGIDRRTKGGVRVYLAAGAGPRLVDGSHLLMAVGRRPNVEGLGLDKAGIDFDRRGIKVSPKLRTTNKRVYAIGDVTGGRQQANLATYQAGLLVRPLFLRLPARPDPAKVPRVVFTDPELAQVGLSEDEAEARHRTVRVFRWPYAETERGRAERRTEGHVKILADADGKLLGAAIAGAGAGELINFWALAIGKEMTLADVSAFVPAYPTLSEIGKRATLAYSLAATRRPATKLLVRLLRLFG